MVKIAATTLAALLLTTPGQDGKRHDRDGASVSVTLAFHSLDADGDGKVTREEFMEAFHKLDRNQDGVLTADEVSTSHPAPHKQQQKKSKPLKHGKH